MNIDPDMKGKAIIFYSFVNFLTHPEPVAIEHVTAQPIDFSVPRYYDYPEIWYCKKGNYLHYTEKGCFECSPGSVVIIPPGMLHSPKIQKNDDVLVEQISLTTDCYAALPVAVHISAITHLFLPNFSDRLGYSVPSFVQLSNESQKQANRLIETPSLQGITQFFKLPEFFLSDDKKAAAIHVAQSILYPLLQAITYMNKNYAMSITMEDMCKLTGLCRSYYHSAFKCFLGISSSVYFVMLKVTRAQFAIAHTNYSLLYISDMCGFASSSYMTKCYKKYKGFLPKLDRARLRKYRKRYPDITISHNYFFTDQI